MKKYGLSEDQLFKIREVIQSVPVVEEAFLYGSRALGNYREGSDIDITLVGEKLSLKELTKIMNDLDELLLPYEFDISLFHQISNQDLIEHIKRVGISLYKK